VAGAGRLRSTNRRREVCAVLVAGYLESGILTLAIPLGLLIVIGLYWTFAIFSDPKEF
jgi:hypothetical protein